MSKEPSGNSHATTWTLVAIVAVPVLYLLSVTPLAILSRGARADPVPWWVDSYAEPARWVYENTPLRGPLKKYCDWCFRRAGWGHVPAR